MASVKPYNSETGYSEEKINLTGAQKSALFILSLKETAAAEIFRNMEDSEIRRIGEAIRSLKKVSAEMVSHVFDEFHAATKGEHIALGGGEQYMRGLIEEAIGPDRASELLGSDKPQQPCFEKLKEIDPKLLANLLGPEHPQTIALVMSQLDTTLGAKIMEYLPEAVQPIVAQRLAVLESISDDVMRDIEDILTRELAEVAKEKRSEFKGKEHVATLLNIMDKKIGNEILAIIEEEDLELATTIRESMFVFDDLINVDRRGIQEILKEISTDDLVLALKATSEELKDKFFANMSTRAAEMLEEDLEAMGPVPLSDVERVQKEISSIALRLQEEGKIVIAGAGGEEMV